MSLSNELDEKLKSRNSYLFRLIIIAYSITVIIRYHYLFTTIECVSIIIYFILFRFLRAKKPFFRVIRLLNDFAFITFILYHTGIANIHLSFFILLPIINVLNHTDKSIRKAFSLQLYLFTAISFFISNHFVLDFYFLIPVVAITVVNLLIAIRIFVDRVNNSLDTVIENFYVKNEETFKSYHLINVVVNFLNEDKFLNTFLKVRRITFFKVKLSSKPYLTISSDFIHNYDFSNLPSDLNFSYLPGITGVINGENIKNAVFIHFHKNEKFKDSNLILIEFHNKVFNILLPILIDKLLIPVLSRILTINRFELEIQTLKRKFIEKTKEEFEAIDSAANAVHFLANKLTPVTNYFKMSYDLKNDKIPVDLRDEWVTLIDADFERANKNIKHIQAKMLQIAQYTNSRNLVTEFEEMKIKTFISYLRKTFLEACFYNADIEIRIPDEMLNKAILINNSALDFVFIEFIDNFNKHTDSDVSVVLDNTEDSESLRITIVNKIKDYQTKAQVIEEYIQDFNTGEVNELLQRKGNKGIKFLKQFLLQSKIGHSCKLVDSYMNFELLIKIV